MAPRVKKAKRQVESGDILLQCLLHGAGSIFIGIVVELSGFGTNTEFRILEFDGTLEAWFPRRRIAVSGDRFFVICQHDNTLYELNGLAAPVAPWTLGEVPVEVGRIVEKLGVGCEGKGKREV